MAGIKVNIGNPADKKTYKKELTVEDASALYGKKLGESVSGSLIGYDGYEFVITGGSDYCGFPMRHDVVGTMRKKILIVKGVGLRTAKRKGLRMRKTVAGNVVNEQTAQVNLKVTKAGSAPLGGAEEPKKE